MSAKPDMNFCYYDIESLENVFTCAALDEKSNHMTMFYLIDTPALLAESDWRQKSLSAIYQNNLQFNGTVSFLDLHTVDAIKAFAKMFGASLSKQINNKSLPDPMPKEFRLACDTDPDFDPAKHPYILGYNSYNYDTTMLALFIYATVNFPNPVGNSEPGYYSPTTAATMREHNDNLFTPKWKKNMPKYLCHYYDNHSNQYQANYQSAPWIIRHNMIMSGRHIDVARLNEKQQHVALKRLLGMLGYQIKESDKLQQNQSTIDTPEQLYDLFAYNCSDVINLKALFHHKKYQADFTLKRQLLQTYPELVYNQAEDAYKPDIRPDNVRRDRLCIDASSAQLATKCLCPYGHLTDIPTVSFVYPAKEKAEEMGIPQVNVLEESKKFFYSLYPNRPDLQAQFDVIYNYYKSIEGHNYNDSETYFDDYGLSNGTLPDELIPIKLSDIPKVNTFLPYFDDKGNPTSCYVIFSTGGIHGAEYNYELFQYHLQQYHKMEEDFKEAKAKYPDPKKLRKAKVMVMSDGRVKPSSYFLKAGSLANSQYRDITEQMPRLFVMKGDKLELNKEYNYTSADMSNHEDFTSYYPNLLRMMRAFFNKGLGYDRYAEIFQQKEDYGKLRKDKSYSQSERDMFDILRNGTKLILNSASGAADAAFQNNIRVNNQIISMRIIGQLFSWRIGQAQAFRGAKVISTNTDGLYTVMEKTLNDKLLEQESADIGVEIEPEPLYLISKDTNNRVELTEKMDIISASGGTLGCRKGPDPQKSLAHPAIIDWALTEYLIVASQHYKGLSLSKPFDKEIGMSILQSAASRFKPVQYMTLMQNIIAASPSSDTYPFGICENANAEQIDDPAQIIIMQHYNRIFLMKDGTPNTIHMMAANAKTITPVTLNKRRKDGVQLQQHNVAARNILRKHGITDIPAGKEAVIKKITNLEPNWFVFVQNKDLNYLTPEEHRFILNNIDLTKYLILLENAYENSWRNQSPEFEEAARIAAENTESEFKNWLIAYNAAYAVTDFEDDTPRTMSDIYAKYELNENGKKRKFKDIASDMSGMTFDVYNQSNIKIMTFTFTETTAKKDYELLKNMSITDEYADDGVTVYVLHPVMAINLSLANQISDESDNTDDPSTAASASDLLAQVQATPVDTPSTDIDK